jgi:hypothetical protein
MGNDLARLPWLFGLARATVRTIRFNLFWAFAYNVIGIGLAMTGRLNPILAALFMVASSACVLTNSLRLRRFNLATVPIAESQMASRPTAQLGEAIPLDQSAVPSRSQDGSACMTVEPVR